MKLLILTAETHLPAGRQEGRREDHFFVCPAEFSGQTRSFFFAPSAPRRRPARQDDWAVGIALRDTITKGSRR